MISRALIGSESCLFHTAVAGAWGQQQGRHNNRLFVVRENPRTGGLCNYEAFILSPPQKAGISGGMGEWQNKYLQCRLPVPPKMPFYVFFSSVILTQR